MMIDYKSESGKVVPCNVNRKLYGKTWRFLACGYLNGTVLSEVADTREDALNLLHATIDAQIDAWATRHGGGRA